MYTCQPMHKKSSALRSHWCLDYDMQMAKDQDHTSNRGSIYYRVDDHLSSGAKMWHRCPRIRKNQWDEQVTLILPIMWPYLLFKFYHFYCYNSLNNVVSILLAGCTPEGGSSYNFTCFFWKGLNHQLKKKHAHAGIEGLSWKCTKDVWMNLCIYR